jgi:hypothetical protein
MRIARGSSGWNAAWSHIDPGSSEEGTVMQRRYRASGTLRVARKASSVSPRIDA